MSNLIIYTTDDGLTKVDLRMENGTVWMSQLHLAELFQTGKQNISKYIQAIFEDKELYEQATVNQKLTVQKERHREVSRPILRSSKRKLLDNAGTISSDEAKEKAKLEYRKYKNQTLDNMEKDYLKTIAALENQAKEESRKKGGKA